MMKIKFIGQAGLILKSTKISVLIDPYLSNNVAVYEPKNQRRQAIDYDLFNFAPNYILITHCHLDHFDKVTLDVFFERHQGITVISPKSVYQEIKKYAGNNKYIELNDGDTYSDESLCIKAVKAIHSDKCAVGYVVTIEKKTFYIVGDSLYDDSLSKAVPKGLDAIFVPINGYGNNMNAIEATALADEVDAKYAVPLHYGMFDDISPDEFKAKNKKVVEIYKETEL